MTDTAMSMAWEAIIGWHGNLSDDEKGALTGRALTELKESLAAVIARHIPQGGDGLTSECELCAGKCRGHSLGHPDQWEPEPGSRAYASGGDGLVDYVLFSERCDWPDATRNYVHELEAQLAQLEAERDHYAGLYAERCGDLAQLEARCERMAGALGRQADNMAFALNNMHVPERWYEKFSTELEEDRQALEKDAS